MSDKNGSFKELLPENNPTYENRRLNDPYAVDRIVRSNKEGHSPTKNAWALFLNGNKIELEQYGNRENCILVPDDIDIEKGFLLPPLIYGLWAWDKLKLELGETAIISGRHAFLPLFAQVALWRGALPLLYLSRQKEKILGVECRKINFEDPEETLEILKREIRGRTGFNALDFSGKPEIIDLLLEVCPRWGKIMLSSKVSEPLTVDYYNNIHKKGAHLITDVFDFKKLFNKHCNKEIFRYYEHACRILKNNKMSNCLVNLHVNNSSCPL